MAMLTSIELKAHPASAGLAFAGARGGARALGRSEIEFSVSAPPPAGLRARAPGPRKQKHLLFWPLHDRYMTVTRPLLPLHCAAGERARPGDL